MEPNRDNIRLWVIALRSGNYKQGFSRLHGKYRFGTSKFCCLGVACRVALKNGLDLEVDEPKLFNSGSVRYGKNGEIATLPNEVMEWLGLDKDDPLLIDDRESSIRNVDGTINASAANDFAEYNFNQIADLIEATYLIESEVPNVSK